MTDFETASQRKLFSRKETAEILRRSTASLSRDIRDGRLKVIRLNRSVYVTEEEINRVLREGF